MIFINPVPSAEIMKVMYATEDYHDCFYDGERHGAYAQTADRIAAHLAPGSRVLDFGCGNGHLMTELKARGLNASGVEFSTESAENASAKTGLEVHALHDDAWRWPGNWDCIHLGDVIEHVPEPVCLIRQCISALAHDGFLSAVGPLEANRSPVHSIAKIIARLKKLSQPTRKNNFPPYHLIFATEAAQQAFFGQFPELHEEFWRVTEDGWPYLKNGAGRNGIARLAIFLNALPAIGQLFGNRFIALYRVEKWDRAATLDSR